MNFSSKLLDDAVNEFAKLPGIGKRTAVRLALHLLKQNVDEVEQFGNTFIRMRKEIKHCELCHNISDTPRCSICSSPKREKDLICVVEDIRDVMAIENTAQYFGLYHVLGGLIAPMDGIGPADLTIDDLVRRVQNNEVKEVIFALSANMEGDTTLFYLHKKLKDFNVPISTISRGVSFGGELEYADEITLGRSILSRIPYENTLSK